MSLTEIQEKLVYASINQKIFARGLAGTGKTTAAVQRLSELVRQGTSPERILLFTPQRSYQEPYKVIRNSQNQPETNFQKATLGGIARRTIELFWPIIAEQAGFTNPKLAPTFLTLETAQYYLMSILQPMLQAGSFSSVIVNKNRLSSQILDNLNKSAMISIDHQTIGDRLASAWSGDKNYLKVYDETQDCINSFREKCLRDNLLDHSLQIELFANYAWNIDLVQSYLRNSVDHILYDNIEEDFPIAHQILAAWSSSCQSTLFLFDEGAGYRKFLGADPISALSLEKSCDSVLQFSEIFQRGTNFGLFLEGLRSSLLLKKPVGFSELEKKQYRQNIRFISTKYFPDLIDEVVRNIEQLVTEAGVSPGEITILAPFLNDSLWFPLHNRLTTKGIPTVVHRPSRSFLDEPLINCVMTLAKVAHPAWGIIPSNSEFTNAIFQIIDGVDLARTKLLCEIVYRGNLKLSSFSQINPDMQKRIKIVNGEKFETIRVWIENYRSSNPLPLDHFFRKLFGELLSQPGFSLHTKPDSVRLLAQLVGSIRKFRQTVDTGFNEQNILLVSKGYIEMLSEGVLTANYQEDEPENGRLAVLIAPAFTFLLSPKSSLIQFWMDAGSTGWFERIDQPLTHPYVLSKNWETGRKWTDADEYLANTQTMNALITGLVRKCTGQIFVGYSQYTESGYEQKGPLVQVLQRLL